MSLKRIPCAPVSRSTNSRTRIGRLRRHAVAALLIVSATPASGAEDGDWYVAWAGNRTNVTVFVESYRGPGWAVGPVSSGYQFSGGRRVSEHFAVDFGLLRSDGLEWCDGYVELPGDQYFRTQTVFDVTALEVGAVGIWSVGRVWEPYIKGGFGYADLGGQQLLTDWSGASFARPVSKASTDMVFAFGVGVNVAGPWQVRLELKSLYIDSEWLGVESDTTIDSTALGFLYRFGRSAVGR